MPRLKVCWGKYEANPPFSSFPPVFSFGSLNHRGHGVHTRFSLHSSNQLNNRFRIPDWFLLLAFCGFFFFWRLASFGLIGADEPRYAQVAQEMFNRHEWITPTLGGSPWLEKPPLYYWQAMLAYRAFGVSDWAARLPSAVDALLMVLAACYFLRRFRPGFELDGALIIATSAGIVGFARAASMDMALAATFTISMLAWYAWFESGNRTYLATFYGVLALAMLAKGPVAPFLAAVILLIFAAAQRSLLIAWKTLWASGVVVFCLVGLPWYVLAQLRNPEFFRVFILEHNLARFGTNIFHHPEPFWYYVPVVLLGWVPWSIFGIVGPVFAIRRFRDAKQDTFRTLLLIWIVTIIFFFSISQAKLPGYILPAIPAGGLLISEYVRERMGSKPHVIIAGLHVLLSAALIFSALLIQYLVLQHRVPWNAATVPLIAALVIASVAVFFLFRYGYAGLRLATLVPAVVALAIALRFGTGPLDDTLSARPLANALTQFDPHHLPVAVFLIPRETEFGLEFYRDQTPFRYESGQVPDGEHLVVVAKRYSRGVDKAAGRKAVYLGEFAPQKFDYFYVPAR
jgi:4-amino-4-deoxy-L-arabinose transferase-like glycosyltransferase